jgi:hypothetical protein
MKILGQYGKFFGSYRNVPWYIEDKNEAEELASRLTKVSEEKGAVAKKISNLSLGRLYVRYVFSYR